MNSPNLWSDSSFLDLREGTSIASFAPCSVQSTFQNIIIPYHSHNQHDHFWGLLMPIPRPVAQPPCLDLSLTIGAFLWHIKLLSFLPYLILKLEKSLWIPNHLYHCLHVAGNLPSSRQTPLL